RGVHALSSFAPTSGTPSQGHLGLRAYAFTYWPYVETLVYWGGSAGEGLILAPAAGVVDAAHRNGVQVLGTIFFPPTVYGGRLEWVEQFVERRDDGTYPAAEAMVAVARYYGFDGWFINQETEGANAETARAFVEIAAAVTAADLHVEWYDAMTESGEVVWQEALNDQNDAFFQQPTREVSRTMFLDFGWTADDLRASGERARTLGRDPGDLFAGVDYQARGTAGLSRLAPVLFPDQDPSGVSLALFRPDETLWQDEENADQRERELWVGADGNPGQDDEGWGGVARYVPPAAAITTLPFLTHFGSGQGRGYFVNGADLSTRTWRAQGWSQHGLQDRQPTWRWWVEGDPDRTNVSLDHEVAYQGGASLAIDVEAGAGAHVRLFAADLVIPAEAALRVAYRAAAETPFAIGLTFADAPEAVEQIPLRSVNAWRETRAPLAAFAGRRLIALSVIAGGEPAVSLNVGRLALDVGPERTRAPHNVRVERRAQRPDGALAIGLVWDAPAEPVHHYEVFQRLPDRSRVFVGGSSGPAAFLPSVTQTDSALRRLEVVAVSRTGHRSPAGTVQL
ncbi:MAG: glycoside hydrolase, partial [Bacteroidota bacterium]